MWYYVIGALSGFDAHSADPLASCELIEEDYTWATEAILASCVRINPRDPPKCQYYSALKMLIL